MNIIYVCSVDDKEKLLSLGYKMLRWNNKSNLYAFIPTEMKFRAACEQLNSLGIKYLVSKVATF